MESALFETKATLSEDVWLPYKVARKSLEDMVAEHDAKTEDVVCQIIKSGKRTLMHTDSDFGLELGILSEVTGARSEQRLLEKILSVLPTKDQDRTLEQAAQSLNGLVATAAYKLSTRGSQGKVDTVRKYVGSILEGIPPKIDDTSSVGFIQKVVPQFQYFVRHMVNPQMKVCVYGAKALEAMLPPLQKKAEANTLKMGDLAQLQQFRFLLETKTRGIVDHLRGT